MKRAGTLLGSVLLVISLATAAFALGEPDKMVTYKVTYHTSAGTSVLFTSYSVVATAEGGYWLQRTTAMSPDAEPLSITQTLLDASTHQPQRYIMYRPAKMNQPASVVDLPLAKMGKDEILPMTITGTATEQLQLEAGTFDTQKRTDGEVTFWGAADVPVLGIAKVETPEWIMEAFSIQDGVIDLLPEKPASGGTVYLEEESVPE